MPRRLSKRRSRRSRRSGRKSRRRSRSRTRSRSRRKSRRRSKRKSRYRSRRRSRRRSKRKSAAIVGLSIATALGLAGAGYAFLRSPGQPRNASSGIMRQQPGSSQSSFGTTVASGTTGRRRLRSTSTQIMPSLVGPSESGSFGGAIYSRTFKPGTYGKKPKGTSLEGIQKAAIKKQYEKEFKKEITYKEYSTREFEDNEELKKLEEMLAIEFKGTPVWLLAGGTRIVRRKDGNSMNYYVINRLGQDRKKMIKDSIIDLEYKLKADKEPENKNFHYLIKDGNDLTDNANVHSKNITVIKEKKRGIGSRLVSSVYGMFVGKDDLAPVIKLVIPDNKTKKALDAFLEKKDGE